jgi:hypothetical protein
MQAYYRIKTQTPDGTYRCLTQPLDNWTTAFQDCLADIQHITQTFYIEAGIDGFSFLDTAFRAQHHMTKINTYLI